MKTDILFSIEVIWGMGIKCPYSDSCVRPWQRRRKYIIFRQKNLSINIISPVPWGEKYRRSTDGNWIEVATCVQKNIKLSWDIKVEYK